MKIVTVTAMLVCSFNIEIITATSKKETSSYKQSIIPAGQKYFTGFLTDYQRPIFHLSVEHNNDINKRYYFN